ncbi:MAG: twin-arginine translocation signal domain-containing protein, partial [Candidatus Hydrogenedentes bacterium]|nr:twin-arginine translocation signal domain-containing protein [Candidatus Hydrogenedentota bacterium]
MIFEERLDESMTITRRNFLKTATAASLVTA